jgi:hydrogenase/urease accessory protein HupE
VIRAPGTATRIILLATLCCASFAASAHRLSPAFFGLSETNTGSFSAKWKVSIPGGLADVLEPKIPDGCSVEGAVHTYVVDDARLLQAEIICDGPLAGRVFTVEGLQATATDVLLRIDYADGRSFTHRLVPENASVLIPANPGLFDVVRTYLVLGIQHILFGVDHLLFVLALLLLVKGFKRLAVTVTAFTIAHSLTLAAATLGWANVPSVPVEATIALSILFLAAELARRHVRVNAVMPATATARLNASLPSRGPAPSSGWPPSRASLTDRFPWLVAFSFGLLHGFGFAGALSEVGLPQQAIPIALLFFNVGVELGQLAFITAVLACGLLLRWATVAIPEWAPRATAYVIGSLAAYWVFERTLLAI